MRKETRELIKKMKKERNWSLNYHRLLLEHDPEMLKKWDELYSTGKFRERFISAREKELIDLGINALMRWSTGLQIHIKKAIEIGITEREITEVFSLAAMSAGIPCMIFASDVYAELKENNFEYFFPQCKIED